MTQHLARVAGRTAVIAGAWWVLLAAFPWWALAAYSAAVAALYWWSLSLQPLMPCWLCRGRGGTPARLWLWPWAQGVCYRCGGRKQFIRLGVKVLTPDRARRLSQQLGTADWKQRRLVR